MKVLYDYQAFMQRHGGVSRYFSELMRAMSATEGFEPILPIPFSDNEYLERKKTFITTRAFKGKNRIMGILNRHEARRSILGDYDIFHPTYYRTYFLKDLRKPLVITVHDMIHETFSSEFVRDDGTAVNKRTLCAHASRIIAVSQSTKDELCRLLDLREDKVRVIHHGTRLRYAGQSRVHARPYILFVGERSGYKNFSLFLRGFASAARHHEVDLVCIGGGAFTRIEEESFLELGIKGRVCQTRAAHGDDLAGYYHFASVFCFPSLCEGFGIPLLEAFACGCPVAGSLIPSFVEVAGDAIQYFDPTRPETIADAICNVVGDVSRAKKRIEAGALRLRDFNWEKSAAQTLSVYREVM